MQSNISILSSIFSVVLFSLSHFADGSPKQLGDILGYGDHLVQGADGKITRTPNLWRDGVIPYIIEGPYNKAELELINSVIKELNTRTCLYFKKRSSNEDTYIKIVSKKGVSCKSYIGVRSPHQPQEVGLEVKECTDRNGIGHELMHALGFIHEHSRPDRDKYVKVLLDNFKKSNEKEKSNMKIDKNHYINVGLPYDINSIMQYGSVSSWGKSNLHPIIVTKNGKRIQQSPGFSESDFKEINLVYAKECANRRRWGGV